MNCLERSYSIYIGDCLDITQNISDKSVDVILCDLPYGTIEYKLNSVVNFELLWKRYRRVISGKGAVVLTAAQPFTAALVMSNPDWFRYAWVWVKNSPGGFAQAKNKPMSKHEDVLVFSSGKAGHVSQSRNRMPYNPQGFITHGKVIKNSNGHRTSAFERRANAKASYVQEFTGYPDSVLNFDCQRDGVHPTQKTVALMEYLVRTYTNECDVVLDNCMGSGTTAVACMNTGRRFIGMEKEAEYFEIAKGRIQEAAGAIPLPVNDNRPLSKAQRHAAWLAEVEHLV